MTTAQRWRSLLRAEPGSATAEHLETAVNLVPDVLSGALAGSITELAGGVYSTTAASSPIAVELDVAQYTDGDGPCMTAARDRQLQHVRDTASAGRFAGFSTVALQHGVRSSMSVPISTPYHPAALNVYAVEPGAFSDRDRITAEFIGRALTRRLLGTAGEPALSTQEAEQVARRRVVVEAALAVIAKPGTSRQQRFAALAARSAAERCSIYDLAVRLTATREGAA